MAVAEAIHFERRASRFLGVFHGTELVPVADRQVLVIDLAADPATLPGGGDVGAVRWRIVGAVRPETSGLGPRGSSAPGPRLAIWCGAAADQTMRCLTS